MHRIFLKRDFRVLFLAVFSILGLFVPLSAFSKDLPPAPPAKYVLGLFQKVISINVGLLNFQDALISRATKDRPIDWKMAEKSFEAAKKQTISLRRMADHLLKCLPSSDPLIPQIQKLQQRLFLVIQAHQRKIARLRELAGDKVEALLEKVEQACGKLPDDPGNDLSDLRFPVNTVEEQF